MRDFIVFSQLSLGPTDWWIGLSIGQAGEEVRCVLYGALEMFSVAAADSLRALNIGFVCRWSDRTEVDFQNWAEAFGARRDRMCVTMSSSSGNHVCTAARVG